MVFVSLIQFLIHMEQLSENKSILIMVQWHGVALRNYLVYMDQTFLRIVLWDYHGAYCGRWKWMREQVSRMSESYSFKTYIELSISKRPVNVLSSWSYHMIGDGDMGCQPEVQR